VTPEPLLALAQTGIRPSTQPTLTVSGLQADSPSQSYGPLVTRAPVATPVPGSAPASSLDDVGEHYDPCYHLSCDDIDNVSRVALDQMSDAAAHATISLAQSTEAINGVRGKGNFNVKHQGPPTPVASLSRS